MTGYDLIFGLPWLEEHNPHIDWRDRTMRFASEHCYANCLAHGTDVLVHSARHKRRPADKETNPAYALMDIHHVTGAAAAAMAARADHDVIWMYPQDFERLERDEDDDRDHVCRVFASMFSVELSALTQEDIEKFHDKLNMPAKSREDVMRKLPG